jgi:hypothetical protein
MIHNLDKVHVDDVGLDYGNDRRYDLVDSDMDG